MKWKTVLGIFLALISVAAIYMWETKFRPDFSLTEVLSVNEDVSEGEIISENMLKLQKISPQSMINGALLKENASDIIGKTASIDLYQNQQLRSDYFEIAGNKRNINYVNFRIPSDWVFSRSSNLLENDIVSIFALPSKEFLGNYELGPFSDDFTELYMEENEYYVFYDLATEFQNKFVIVPEVPYE